MTTKREDSLIQTAAETLLAFGGVRRHQFDQRRPWHHTLHLREELPLARALGRQVQAQIGLLHGSDRKHVAGRVMQTIPRIQSRW